MLLSRGKARSLQFNIKGNNQFPNPPIIIGITIKKIIINACALTKTLKIWSDPKKDPILDSSIRIITLIDDPIKPISIPKHKYKLPIILWFVENIQTLKKIFFIKLV